MAAIHWAIVALLVVCVAVSDGTKTAKKKAAPLDIGLREMPAEDSAAMAKFKKSLSAEQQKMMKSQLSKTRFIQALLDTKRSVDKRDKVETLHVEERCCNCNPGAEGCYRPDDVKRSRIIRCCIPVANMKRQQADANEVMSELSVADLILAERHASKLQNLVEAAHEPAGEVEKTDVATDEKKKSADKRQMKTTKSESSKSLEKLRSELDILKKTLQNVDTASIKKTDAEKLKQMSTRLLSDAKAAKAKGVKLDDLLSSMKKRAASGAKN